MIEHSRVSELESALLILLQQVREDMPRDSGTRHLWDAVEDAESVLYSHEEE